MNCKSISAKYFIRSKPRKFSPAKLQYGYVAILKNFIVHTFLLLALANIKDFSRQ